MKTPFALSIKTKFFLTAAVIMAFSSATWGGWAWYNERQHLHQKLRENGKLLVTALRAPIINAFIYEDAGLLDDVGVLDTFVEEVIKSPELSTVYVFITDKDGKILAHNDYTNFGSIASDHLTRTALQSQQFLSEVTRLKSNEDVLDLALPLLVAGKSWGTLRVGLSMTPLQRELDTLKWQVFTFAGIFFLFGTAAFYIIGLTMSRPLERLSQAMSDLNQDSLPAVPEATGRQDEIGDLQESFRQMVLRLQQSEKGRQLAVSRLLRAEKLATIGEIVAGVAHEVNNPLGAMAFSIASLEKKAPQELTRHIGIVKGGLSRIETIVRQLSEFSRAGSLDLGCIKSDVFFKETAQFAVMALKRFPVRFTALDECVPCSLSLDKGKMHQVVLNLLLNAGNASPAGGCVRLTAAVADGFYLLSVKDQGQGIAAEQQPLIFELFYTTNLAGEGSGIGLAICKNIVEMHRGEIVVVSTPGETIFTVKIPLVTGEMNGSPEVTDCRG